MDTVTWVQTMDDAVDFSQHAKLFSFHPSYEQTICFKTKFGKEIFEFQLVVLGMKIDLESHPACGRGVG